MLAFLVAAQTFVADRFDKKDRGATAVEYGIMVAAIAVAVIVIVFTLGDTIADMFTDINGRIGNGGTAPAN